MHAAERRLVEGTMDLLRRHLPFDTMAADALRHAALHLRLAYYPRGQEIVGPQDGVADRLFIVKQGRVRGGAGATPDEALGEGEFFPIGALVARHAATVQYRADADSFCWELPAERFHELLQRSPQFHAFCTNHLASLAERSQRALRAEAAESLADTAGMLAPLRSAVRRAAVSCAPQTPLAEVARAMHAAAVGSMVVVDTQQRPIGIFTVTDVLPRVTLAQAPMDTPIERLMTPAPVCLEEEATLVEAAVAMARRGIRHVAVTRDGRLSGVISERDLFALQRVSLTRATGRVRAAASPDELAAAAREQRLLARQLLAQGVDAEHVTQMTSALNDGLSQKLIELVARARRLPARWCWLALGSEGRLEQTLATDQDNALLFVAEGDPAAARQALLAFAGEVNRGLEASGFPLCKGEIMARNPRWCLTLEEWRRVFGDWIRNPHPEALLNAAIFFDFRPLAGEAGLAGTLRETVLAQTRVNPAFCRAMIENALRTRTPVGLLRDFTVEESGEHAGTLDLKGSGARLLVDAARVLALAHAIPATSTAARLREAAAAGAVPRDEAAAAVDAFHHIQALRLKRQYLGDAPAPGAENRIDPEQLNAVDRRILKASLRQAGRLQERLKLEYAL
jgi:CBS domain-containing protein